MKRFSKKTVSVLLMTILILTATAGSAWAYFTDYEQLAGSAVIKLGHSTYIEEQTTEDSKTVGIQNTGEADVIVKVMLYGPDGMTVEGNDDWQITDNKNGSFLAYYKKILPPGETTSTITASITDIPVTIENMDTEITVTQECYVASFDDNNEVIAPDNWEGFPTIKA